MGALNVNGSTKVADFKQFARSCLATCPYTDAAVNTLQWRHNERDGVSNHQPHVCLLSYLYSRRAKKISKLRVTGLCEGNTGEFPHKRSLTRKMFPFDDVIIFHSIQIQDCIVGLIVGNNNYDTARTKGILNWYSQLQRADVANNKMDWSKYV